jgi:hypothetical protein
MSILDDLLVNRDREKTTIEHRLDAVAKRDVPSRDIFQFYGIFGIGKTALLHALKEFFVSTGIDHVYIDLSQYTEIPHELYIIEELSKRLHGSQAQKDRIDGSIREYQDLEHQLTLIGALKEPFQTSKDPLSSLAARIEEEFVQYLSTIPEEKPVFLLFDRIECLTQGPGPLKEGPSVRSWLERLFQSVKSYHHLTFILAGRDRVRDWNSRNGKMRAEDPLELSFFAVDDTKEQWRRMSLGTPYQALYVTLGEFVHAFTFGHPYSNVCLEGRLKQLQTPQTAPGFFSSAPPGISPNWALIFKETTESMLNDWLRSSSELDLLKEFVRAIAPLRRFDRPTASYMFKELRPNLALSLKEPNIQGYLIYLKRVTLLYKESEETAVYRMQTPIRRFIIEDLNLNASAECKKAHELARAYYRNKIPSVVEGDSPDPRFKRFVAELLYHEAKLSRRDSDPTNHGFRHALEEDLDYALGEFYDPVLIDKYLEMHDELTEVLGQDEELKAAIGEREFGSLMDKMSELRSTRPSYVPYDVFLSYHSKDQNEVLPIAEKLRAEGIRIWWDEWAMLPFTRVSSEIGRGIKQSRTAAICIGISGVGPWQELETSDLLCEHVERRMPLGLVLLPSCPVSFQAPPFMRVFHWIDLRPPNPESIERLISFIKGRRSSP